MVFFFYVRLDFMICFVISKFIVEFDTCGIESRYYDRLSFHGISTLNLLVLSYLTVFKVLRFLYCFDIYVQDYLLGLDVQLKW